MIVEKTKDLLKKHGWKKVHGYKIDHSMLCDDFDFTYIEARLLSETVKEVDFYMNDKFDVVYEELDDVMEWIMDAEQGDCEAGFPDGKTFDVAMEQLRKLDK